MRKEAAENDSENKTIEIKIAGNNRKTIPEAQKITPNQSSEEFVKMTATEMKTAQEKEASTRKTEMIVKKMKTEISIRKSTSTG